MKNILLVGPLPKPTTGVSLANKIVLENLKKKSKFKIDFINTSYSKFEEKIGSFSFAKAIFYLKLNLFTFKIFKADIIYLTPGQTFFGVFKYFIFIVFTRVLNKDLIIHVHGNHLGAEYNLLTGIKKKLFKFLLSKTSKGIVLSESLKNNMSPFISNENIFVLYNFVEDYLFVDKETISNKYSSIKPRIVFLSNLMEEKGIFDLFEALELLEKEGIQFEAKIAGNIDAKHKNKIENYFKSLKNTQYCGVVSGSDKKALLLWSNTFILPTYYSMEGQPISILEAMATGNIVLTTNHAGIPDIFEDGINGYYIEKKNPFSISSVIKMTIENHNNSEIIRMTNYNVAMKKYRVDNFIKCIEKIFQY